MISFGERIRTLAAALGKEEKDVASDLGLTKSQMSHYVNGNRKVPSDLLQKIVDTYNISPLFLFRDNVPLYDVEKEPKHEYDFFPSSISAGLPINVDGMTKSEKISLSDSVVGKWSGNKEIFFTRINGDSMNKIMPDGSLIAIRPTSFDQIKDGDIVVFSKDGEYSVKFYYKYPDKIVFKPYSYIEAFHDQPYTFEENVMIHGKVVLYIVEMD